MIVPHAGHDTVTSSSSDKYSLLSPADIGLIMIMTTMILTIILIAILIITPMMLLLLLIVLLLLDTINANKELEELTIDTTMTTKLLEDFMNKVFYSSASGSPYIVCTFPYQQSSGRKELCL